MLRGSLKIGEEEKLLNKGEVGWLNVLTCDAQSELNLTAGEEGVCFVLFATKPQDENIVAYGTLLMIRQKI